MLSDRIFRWKSIMNRGETDGQYGRCFRHAPDFKNAKIPDSFPQQLLELAMISIVEITTVPFVADGSAGCHELFLQRDTVEMHHPDAKGEITLWIHQDVGTSFHG